MYKLTATQTYTAKKQELIQCVVIDDDADDREILTSILSEVCSAYSATSFSNPVNAYRFLLDPVNKPNLIFIDLNMPFMSGKDLLKKLRNEKHLEKVPIVVYSTSSNIVDVMQTSMLGATHYLTKPAALKRYIFLLDRLLTHQPLPYYLNHLEQKESEE